MNSMDSVVRAHGAALLAYATRVTGGDRHAAEDVVQETWLRTWRNVDRLGDGTQLAALRRLGALGGCFLPSHACAVHTL
jgi:DNA-directed RNA polymerase specialized sigma24 family protein